MCGCWLKIIFLGEYVVITCYTDANLIFFLLENYSSGSLDLFFISVIIFFMTYSIIVHIYLSFYGESIASNFYIVVNLHYLSCDCLISQTNKEPLMTQSRPYFSTLFILQCLVHYLQRFKENAAHLLESFHHK